MPEIPDLDDFRIALSDRGARARMGIQLSDGDAALLIADDDWAQTYYRQWLGEPVAADPAAPIALPRAVALAPALPAPVATAVVELEPVPPRRWRVGHPIRAGVVAAMAGSVIAAALVLVGIPHATADATPGTGTAADPFPAGLDAAATTPPTSAPVADPVDRLGDDVSVALRLDDRTAAAPAVSGIVQKEVARIADVACLSGYDDVTAGRIADAVAGRSDLDEAAGNAVADAIARYCAATTG